VFTSLLDTVGWMTEKPSGTTNIILSKKKKTEKKLENSQ